MPCPISFVRPNVLYVHQSGVMTLEEIAETFEKSYVMCDQVGGEVHLIVDTRELESYPANLLKVRRLLNRSVHPNFGYYVLITQSAHMRFVGPMVMQLFIPYLRCKIVETPEEAFAFIDTLAPERTTHSA